MHSSCSLLVSARRLLFILVMIYTFAALATTPQVVWGQVGIELLNHAPSPSSDYADNEKVAEKLNSRVNVFFDEISLADLLANLKKATGHDVFIDQTAFDSDFDEQTVISCEFTDVRLRTALQLILNEHGATYFIDGGMIKIISQEASEDPQYFRKRIIDCRELLTLIARNEVNYPNLSYTPNNSSGGVFSQPASNLPQLGQSARPNPNQVQGSGEPSAGADLARTSSQAPYLLVDTIKLTVTPDGWDDTNGDFSLNSIGGMMVISANEVCITQTEELLAELLKSLRPAQK